MRPSGIPLKQVKALNVLVVQHLQIKHPCRPGQILVGSKDTNVALSIHDVAMIEENKAEVHYHINDICFNDNFYIEPIYVDKQIHLAHLT